jgi:hypothetical protein
VLLLAGIFSLGYWLGFDHGRARGFNAGVEGHLAASWALSVDGLQAYELWKGGDLEHLTACDRPGWKLEYGVCFPRADEGKIYGWHVR